MWHVSAITSLQILGALGMQQCFLTWWNITMKIINGHGNAQKVASKQKTIITGMFQYS
jgi:hypothetical protein